MTDLRDLLVLQQRDTAVDQLRHRRATLPERTLVTAIQEELTRLRAELAVATGERDALAARQERLEADVAAGEAKRRTLEGRLASTSVPREAQVMSEEIDGIKARQLVLEDEELEIMEALEPIETTVVAGQAQEEALEQRLTDGREALAHAETAIDGEIADAVVARAAAVQPIPSTLLERYERLRTKLAGVAVATLDGARCTGCNLTLPTLEIERLRGAAPDAIVECEQCGRILVL
ncbi:MAG TPA: C4-type zinc ribbon domain-containing protein [Acidimicrobiales bacterium]